MSQPPLVPLEEKPYALDSSLAESQKQIREVTLVDEDTRERNPFILQGGPQPLGKLDVAYKPNLQNEASRKNQSKGTVKLRKNVYEKYLDTHADVWSFYLKETEAEDKELVEFWKDGLDSLLIFAGLFAAVLTAFLIESRKGLEDDPVQNLLQQINQALRNDSSIRTPDIFHPSQSSLSVNFLWFISLTFTLTSGLTAVLAQGWIKKYIPVSAGRACTSGDAYRRHLRVIRAHQWHLTGVLGVIPLLLQLSVLFFLVGLVIFVWSDSNGIGKAIIVLTAVTSVLYAIATALPWLSPGNPIETTLSLTFHQSDGLANRSSYRLLQLDSSRGKWISKAWGLFLGLFNSPEQDTVKVLILAWIIANPTPDNAKDEAVKAMAGLPENRWHEMVHGLMIHQAFHRLFKRSEAIMEMDLSNENEPDTEEELRNTKEAYLIIILRLIAMVEPPVVAVLGNEYNSVRVDALKAFAEFSKQPELIPVIKDAIPDILEMLRDEDENTSVRTAALESLVRSSKQVELIPLMKNAIPVVFEMLRDKNIEISARAAFTIYELSDQSELFQEIKAAMPSAIKGFKEEYSKILDAALTALSGFIEKQDLIQEIKDASGVTLEMLQDENLWIHDTFAKNLGGILEQSKLLQAIKRLIPYVIKRLEKDLNNALADFVEKHLYKHIAILSAAELLQAIRIAMNSALDILLDVELWMKCTVTSIFTRIFELPECIQVVKITIPIIIEMLKNEYSELVDAALDGLPKIVKKPRLVRAIRNAVPAVLDILQDKSLYTSQAFPNILDELLKNSEVIQLIKTAIPTTIKTLKHSNKSIRTATLSSLCGISKQRQFIQEIRSVIPIILDMRNDDDPEIREMAMKTLSEFSKQAELDQLIKELYPLYGGPQNNESAEKIVKNE